MSPGLQAPDVTAAIRPAINEIAATLPPNMRIEVGGAVEESAKAQGPIRKVRYELVNRVPIFDYTEPGLRQLLAEHGFTRVEIVRPGKSGYVVRAQP